jgi:hypothetical protein
MHTMPQNTLIKAILKWSMPILKRIGAFLLNLLLVFMLALFLRLMVLSSKLLVLLYLSGFTYALFVLCRQRLQSPNGDDEEDYEPFHSPARRANPIITHTREIDGFL